MTLRILVRGSNDIGSAVAHSLFRAGHAGNSRCATTCNNPPQNAFAEAFFCGSAVLEEVEAKLVKRSFLLRGILAESQYIPVASEKLEAVLQTVHSQVLVDARMRKHQQPEPQHRLVVPLTIGLGPNFVAGTTTELAIETGWGERLGQVISLGATRALEGEPKKIDGHARDRYMYAPCSGVFHTRLQPGDPVEQGQEIAHIDQTVLHAPLTGLLRGITRDGVPVTANTNHRGRPTQRLSANNRYFRKTGAHRQGRLIGRPILGGYLRC